MAKQTNDRLIGFSFAGLVILALVLIAMSKKAGTEPGRGPEDLSGSPNAPDFSLPSLDGSMVSLSQYQGKQPVMLVFFATWCQPCNIEVPILNDIQKTYASRGLVLLAIDLQESEDRVRQWAKRKRVEYPILLDQKGTVGQAYGVYAIPTNVVLDFDGKVSFWHNVLPDKRELDRLFAQAAQT